MTRVLSILATAALTLTAVLAKEPASGKSAKPAKAAAKAADPGAPPADAEKQSDGSFLSRDASGKRWVHKRTPFGWARYEDAKPSAESKPAAAPDPTRAVADLGDSVRFEKPGPFGTFRWERKKTEFNDTEKAAWERLQTARRQ